MPKIQKNVLISIVLLIIIPIGTISPFVVNRIKRGPENHIIPTEPFTMDINFGMAGVNADSNTTEYQVYQNMSISSTRRDFSWDKIENEPGNMTWDRYDNFLDNMTAINISVLGLLNFDNNVVETQSNDTGTDKYIAPEDIPLFLNYVNETLNRYQHRVMAWGG